MEFKLPYGKGFQRIKIPDDVSTQVLRPNHLPEPDSDEAVVRRALANPIGTPSLSALLTQNAPTLLVVPDKTRNARLDVVLPILLEEIQKAGVSPSNIHFLFANGSHAGMSVEEKQAILGEDVASRFAAFEHDCRRSACSQIGVTRRGIPVKINKKVLDAAHIIVVGTVVHHYFAGFGGGPKMIVPGVAACDTITRNHRMAVLSEESVLHPACRPGNTDGNPVYEDIEEAFRMAPVDFSVQVVLNQEHGIQAAFAGDTLRAHRRGREVIEKMNRVPIPHQFDCVIVSAGGFPKDVNLIQAHKAIYNAFQAVRPGGCLIVLAACPDGIGSPTFLRWFDFADLARMKKAVMEEYQLNGNTALSLKEKLDAVAIYWISELPREISLKIGFQPVASFEEAWSQARKRQTITSVAVLPHGDVTLPQAVERP